eukprot:8089254-Lingulodinium_polyedra.AAC.1
MQQWAGWIQHCEKVGLPRSALQEGEHHERACSRELGASSWCLSTVAVITMLVRWASTLKSSSSRSTAAK